MLPDIPTPPPPTRAGSASSAKATPQPFEPDAFRPTSSRRRVLLMLMAVAMACVGIWATTRHAGKHPPVKQADIPRCADGQTEGCVGGKAQVIVPAASR